MPLTRKQSFLGYGLGLRVEHYESILQHKPDVDWFEIITENFLISGGKPLYNLDKIRENYPLVMHGVSMSLGSCDDLNWEYLSQVKNLNTRIEAQWISDHLCFTGIDNKNTHDLLPVPYTQEAIHHVVGRIQAVQNFLGQAILIENISSYIDFNESTMCEWEFLKEVITRSGCLLLLDINNVYVNSINHEFDPWIYINSLPSHAIQQIHLAGHLNKGHYAIDTHDQPIIAEVWALYSKTLKRHGLISTMIERDEAIPPLFELLSELNNAKKIASNLNGQCDA